MSRDFILVSCEHGGNRIPACYRRLFDGYEFLLHTHRGYDAGALRLARELAGALHAPLFACIVSRLLIDLNRSPGHPKLYSEATRAASAELRQEICHAYYLPYRSGVEARLAQEIARGKRAIHISCHSFIAHLDGKARDADIGLLYDPSRPGERGLCRRWRAALNAHSPALKVRLNYPYQGKSDGFTTALRKRFSAENYLGIELEINQKLVAAGAERWRNVRGDVIESLRQAMLPSQQQ